MTVKVMNDAAVLDQVQEHWMKIAALIVWKLAPKGVTISVEDIKKFSAEDGILLTHGHRDSFEFKIVTTAEAERIAAHDAATNRGRA